MTLMATLYFRFRIVTGLSAFAAAVLLAAGGAAAQQVDAAEPRNVQPLMENWRFVQDVDLTDEAALADTAEGWETVTLPHTWNAEDAATPDVDGYARGLGWYRLEFASPESGVRHWLEIGAASLVADVWLNGQHLGQHKGGFTAFRFDVTEQLAPQGGPNVLLVKVNNDLPSGEDDITAIAPLGGDFNVSGGLYRHVSLISTAAPAYFALDDLGGPGVYAATTSVAGGNAVVDVRAKLGNAAETAADYVVRLSLLDAEGEPAATAEQSVSLEPASGGEVTAALEVPGAHLWQGVADPYLYRLVAELLGPDGAVVDRVVQSFGIRQMRFDPNEGFFLNGQHVRLNGVAIHQDFQGKGWAVSNEDVDTSLALVMEIGANAVRLGHYPFSRYTLQRISELGLVAWAEAALGLGTTVETCGGDPTPEFVENAKQQLRELIRQQYNYPAVAMWAVGNETSARQLGCDEAHDNVTPVVSALHEVAKEEDPHRATAYAEFAENIGKALPFPTAGTTDVLGTNRYYYWYDLAVEEFEELLGLFRERYPDQPLGISEYGAGAAIDHHTDNPLGGPPEVRSAPEGEVTWQPEEYAAWVHEQNYRIISGTPFLWGSFVWNMFDFGSANRNEGGVIGVNTKGLVTFDRQTRKDPFFFYKANWSSEPVTYIVGRRYTERAYVVTDVKVYSNADSVELSVNDTPVASLTTDQCELKTCVFEDVPLAAGANTVTATGTHGGEFVTDTVEWSLAEAAVDTVGISAGRLQTGYVSSTGVRCGSDDFFEGGEGLPVDEGDAQGGIPEIANTDDPMLYKFYRAGEFRYEIPLPDGSYDVTLGFIEPDEDAGEGDRVFNVRANGEPALDGYDVTEAAGGAGTAVTATFTAEVTGGILTLEFTPVEGEAVVSNIRIVPAAGTAQ